MCPLTSRRPRALGPTAAPASTSPPRGAPKGSHDGQHACLTFSFTIASQDMANYRSRPVLQSGGAHYAFVSTACQPHGREIHRAPRPPSSGAAQRLAMNSRGPAQRLHFAEIVLTVPWPEQLLKKGVDHPPVRINGPDPSTQLLPPLPIRRHHMFSLHERTPVQQGEPARLWAQALNSISLIIAWSSSTLSGCTIFCGSVTTPPS
jgi:hypothetical protein